MPILEVRNIRYFEHKMLLDDVSFTVEPGETVILAGTPEAGRSVLLKVLSGILPPTEGSILLLGTDFYEADPKTIIHLKRLTGFSFQNEGLLSNLTIEENLLLPVKYFDPDHLEEYRGKISSYLEHFGLVGVLDKRPAQISIPKKKVLAFIRSVLLHPRILFMDDPFFNLDILFQRKLLDCLRILKREGVTLVLSTNSESMMYAMADKVLFFHMGMLHRTIPRHEITPETLKVVETLLSHQEMS